MGDKPVTMNAKDTISGSAGECFIKFGGKRYNFMSVTKVEAKVEKTKSEVAILGKPGKGNKSTGWKGKGSATAHYNTSIIRDILTSFKDGTDTYFEMQITNNDATSAVGKQTTILKDCNIDGGVIALIDASKEVLEEDFDFTFDDWEMSATEKFTMLSGMEIKA